MPTTETQRAFEGFREQFDRNPEPNWADLAIFADLCEDVGEERLAFVCQWMCKHQKWPWLSKLTDGWAWFASGTLESSSLGETLFTSLHGGIVGLNWDLGSFLDAIRDLSVGLHLQSFEEHTTPDWISAKECADWLGQYDRRAELVVGLKWCCKHQKWPAYWQSGTTQNEPWAWSRDWPWGRHLTNELDEQVFEEIAEFGGSRETKQPLMYVTWSDSVEAVGRAVVVK